MSRNAAPALAAEPTETVADLRAKLAVANARIEKLQSDLDRAESNNARLETNTSYLEDEIDELESRIEEVEAHLVGEDEIETLAAIRAALKSGDVDRAREGIERLLDGLDSCWRTRPGVVVGQGALL